MKLDLERGLYMKKNIKSLIVMVFTIITLTIALMGCNKNENKNEILMGDMKEDIYVISGATDVTLFGDMGDNYFMSYIISKDELTKENIEVKMDTSISFIYDLTETKVEEMPYNVFLEYKGFKWDEYAKLNSKSDKSEAEEYFSSYMEEYNNLKDVNNKFYFYTLGIGFQDVENITEKKECISNISVVCNEKEYKLDCNINLYRKVDDAGKVGKIAMKSAGKWNLPIIPNKDGIIASEFNAIEFVANDNIKISLIKLHTFIV